MKIQMIYISI